MRVGGHDKPGFVVSPSNVTSSRFVSLVVEEDMTNPGLSCPLSPSEDPTCGHHNRADVVSASHANANGGTTTA